MHIAAVAALTLAAGAGFFAFFRRAGSATPVDVLLIALAATYLAVNIERFLAGWPTFAAGLGAMLRLLPGAA